MGCTKQDVRDATKAVTDGVKCLREAVYLNGKFDNSPHKPDDEGFAAEVAYELNDFLEQVEDIHSRIQSNLPKATEALRRVAESVDEDTPLMLIGWGEKEQSSHELAARLIERVLEYFAEAKRSRFPEHLSLRHASTKIFFWLQGGSPDSAAMADERPTNDCQKLRWLRDDVKRESELALPDVTETKEEVTADLSPRTRKRTSPVRGQDTVVLKSAIDTWHRFDEDDEKNHRLEPASQKDLLTEMGLCKFGWDESRLSKAFKQLFGNMKTYKRQCVEAPTKGFITKSDDDLAGSPDSAVDPPEPSFSL